MKVIPIRSVSDAANPRPWAIVRVQDGSPNFRIDMLNGVLPFKEGHVAREQGRLLTGQERATAARDRRGPYQGKIWDLPRKQGQLYEENRPEPKDERHAVIVTVDGDILFLPESEQEGFYYAHLAWYDPLTKEWEVLEFVEDTHPSAAKKN